MLCLDIFFSQVCDQLFRVELISSINKVFYFIFPQLMPQVALAALSYSSNFAKLKSDNKD